MTVLRTAHAAHELRRLFILVRQRIQLARHRATPRLRPRFALRYRLGDAGSVATGWRWNGGGGVFLTGVFTFAGPLDTERLMGGWAGRGWREYGLA